MNTFYHGDCKFVMKHDIPDESVDLIYLDPPFFTGKVQKGTKKWQPGAMEVSYEDSKRFWGDTQKVNAMRLKAPEWLIHIANTRPDFASYLYYMMERLEACHKVLKDTGSIYLHCDWRASHYLKMIMDEIFDYGNFRNEIIWCYSGGGIPVKDFPRKHDIIFRYSKTNNYSFQPEYKPYKDNTQQVGKHSTYAKGNLDIDLDRGTPVTDWWNDIRTATGWAKERKEVGYPTQKPLALLERIIKASSNEGNIILDPFCGCGTAIIAAQRLNRQWIGIDISKDAYEVSTKRHNELPLDFTHMTYIERTLDDVLSIESPQDFEKWVNECFKAHKPSPDKGVDGITSDNIPIQTKTFKVNYSYVSKLVADAKYHPQVKQPFDHAIIVSQKGFDDGARQRQFEIQTKEGITVDLLTPADMLKDKDGS